MLLGVIADDFTGASDIVKAKIKSVNGKAAVIGGENWSLDGTVREASGVAAAEDARAVIRVEQISVSDQPQAGGLEMNLDDSIYLGDRWEYRLSCSDFVAKAHGAKQLSAGTVWARIPSESVWVFSAGQR